MTKAHQVVSRYCARVTLFIIPFDIMKCKPMKIILVPNVKIDFYNVLRYQDKSDEWRLILNFTWTDVQHLNSIFLERLWRVHLCWSNLGDEVKRSLFPMCGWRIKKAILCGRIVYSGREYLSCAHTCLYIRHSSHLEWNRRYRLLLPSTWPTQL